MHPLDSLISSIIFFTLELLPSSIKSLRSNSTFKSFVDIFSDTGTKTSFHILSACFRASEYLFPNGVMRKIFCTCILTSPLLKCCIKSLRDTVTNFFYALHLNSPKIILLFMRIVNNQINCNYTRSSSTMS